MGHNTPWADVTWEFIKDTSQQFRLIAPWTNSGQTPPISPVTINSWISSNGNQFRILWENSRESFTNTELDSLLQFRVDANTIINKMQKILEPVILDLEIEPSTEPFIDIMPEIELKPRQNNTLRNALLIGGAILLL